MQLHANRLSSQPCKGVQRDVCFKAPALARVPRPRRSAFKSFATPASTQHSAAVVDAPAQTEKQILEENNLVKRHEQVQQHFPLALGVDDFMARVEVALNGFGFTGDNSIAITSLCRDEVTVALKDKIESVFGNSFCNNGLGAMLTCGITGMGAGLSHSPMSNGKEHYVFFAFPHVAINSRGEVGAITRPGRPKKSCACGALQKCLIELKSEGVAQNCKVPGVHDPLDPEYSILKQRLARRIKWEGLDMQQLGLVELTKVAKRVISDDLEYLIDKMVNKEKANYAVVTGVQIHNWATELTASSGVPSLEFVAPYKVYVVNDGVKTAVDLDRVPTLSPRQLQLMAKASIERQSMDETMRVARTSLGTLKELPFKYLTQRLGVIRDPEDEAMSIGGKGSPTWQSGFTSNTVPLKDPSTPNMESH